MERFSFENCENILHEWEKDKVEKSLVEALNRYEKQEEELKIGLGKTKTIALSRI